MHQKKHLKSAVTTIFKALVNEDCCGHIVAHDVSWAAQTGKHLLRTQNVSEQNQKRCFVSTTNVARAGKRGNICVGNNVSLFARALTLTEIAEAATQNIIITRTTTTTTAATTAIVITTMTITPARAEVTTTTTTTT